MQGGVNAQLRGGTPRPSTAAPAPLTQSPLPLPKRFDHPDAPETDLAEAARQLRTATAHDYARQLASPPPKRKGGAGLLGGGGLFGGGGKGEARGQAQDGEDGSLKPPPPP